MITNCLCASFAVTRFKMAYLSPFPTSTCALHVIDIHNYEMHPYSPRKCVGLPLSNIGYRRTPTIPGSALGADFSNAISLSAEL